MKNIIYTLLFLAAALQVAAAEKGDTVTKYYDARNLTIIENEEGVKVEVTDADGETTYFNNASKGDGHSKITSGFNRIKVGCCDRWDLVCGGLNFGFVTTPGTSSAASPDMGKSMEIGWLNIIGVERRLPQNWRWSLGVGIDWRNYRSTSGLVFATEDRHVNLSDEEIEGYRFSRIKIFSLQFPLLMTKKFKKRSGLSPSISFGPIFNLNPHGSVKTSWKDEKGKNRYISTDKIGQRKFTIDLYGQLTLSEMGVYVRYTPYKILTGAVAPDYRSLSVGIILFP